MATPPAVHRIRQGETNVLIHASSLRRNWDSIEYLYLTCTYRQFEVFTSTIASVQSSTT